MLFLISDYGLLTERPFIAEVWGTVADWSINILTFITAWLLLYTLREQRRVTKTGQEVFRIQMMPYLNIEYEQRATFNEGVEYNLNITVENADAYDFTVEAERKSDLFDYHQPNFFRHKLDFSKGSKLEILIKVPHNTDKAAPNLLFLHFTFFDVLGNGYSKRYRVYNGLPNHNESIKLTSRARF